MTGPYERERAMHFLLARDTNVTRAELEAMSRTELEAAVLGTPLAPATRMQRPPSNPPPPILSPDEKAELFAALARNSADALLRLTRGRDTKLQEAAILACAAELANKVI
jgi:hypothetical protein